jgi:iron complex outermembrane receptor protein
MALARAARAFLPIGSLFAALTSASADPLAAQTGAGSSAAGRSASSADTVRTYGVAPVVVTAERSRTPLAATTAAVSVVSGAELRRAPVRTLADALQRVPGLAFLDLDGLGLNPVPTVRGFYGGGEAEYVVVLVDGKPLNALQTGVVPWELIPVSAVERIEVVRGGASSLFGDAALGGVVNVVTRGEGARAARWSVQGGELASWRGSGSVSMPRGSVYGDVHHTDGFRDHAGRTAAVAGGSLPFAVGRGTVTLTALTTWRDFREPGPLTAGQVDDSRSQSDPFFRFDRTRDRLARLGVETALPVAAAATVTGYLTGELRHTDGVRTNLLAAGFADTQARVVDASRLLGSVQVEVPALPAGKGKLVAGTDFSAGRARSAYQPVVAGPLPAYAAASGSRGGVEARGTGSRSAAAGFAQYELKPVDAVRLSLGGRVDWLRDAFHPSLPRGAEPARADHTAFSPRAGINVRVLQSAAQEGNVYLTAGRSFKAATVDQLYDQRTYPVPFPPYAITISNPLLRPQRGTSVEAGLYHRAALGGGISTDVSLSAYRMEMRDELDFDIQTFRYVNIGRSRHRGIEASARVSAAPASLFTSYTLQDVVSRTGDNQGKALKAIPRHFLSAGIDAGRGTGLAGSLSASRAWGIWLDDADTRRLPAFTRVDGRLSYPVRRVRITLDAFNLLDRKYSTTGFLDPGGSDTAFYFPAAGRTLQLGIGSSF